MCVKSKNEATETIGTKSDGFMSIYQLKYRFF